MVTGLLKDARFQPAPVSNYSRCADATCRRAECEAEQRRWHAENPRLAREGLVTRAVLCDKPAPAPPCIAPLLFDGAFYRRSHAASRCARWADSDWPTDEPLIDRATQRPRPRGFWEVMRLLPNRTVWIHGDSIQIQLCAAARCSLIRDGVAPSPVVGVGRDGTWAPSPKGALATRTGLNYGATTLPNGATLVCSGVGNLQADAVRQTLDHVDVAILNHGLHYHAEAAVRRMLGEAFGLLAAWRAADPTRRVPLWREASAQHFAGGSYTEHDQKRFGYEPCRCTALAEDSPKKLAKKANLNALALVEEQRLAARRRVELVPFFNLTAPRHDMHLAHYCSYDGQKTVGRCCDCTHFCYTPAFWDAAFGGLHRSVRRALARRPNVRG